MFITDTTYFLYMTNDPRGALYVGLTSDLPRRAMEHRERLVPGFTQRYHLTRLVWYEGHLDPSVAAHREPLMKRWRRSWKIELIERSNPTWADVFETVLRQLGVE